MKMKKICCYLGGLSLTFGLVACGNDQQASTPAPVAEVVTETPAPAAADVIKGKVAEVMDASGYTYLRLDDGSGTELWAAVPKTNVEVGEEVVLQGGSVMQNFSSKTLDRTFESIIFSSGIVRDGGDVTVGSSDADGSFSSAVQDAGSAAASLASGGSAGNVVDFAELKIEKAAGENAQTVGDVFAQAVTLDTQTITIKGQVVKVSKNIMGKNWLHLQDGTGDPQGNTHDLVVTTDGMAEKGEIVTVQGVVAANKDFGSGYKYDVIVEEATVIK